MGIAGKHVLKTFGEFKDIKVRCDAFLLLDATVIDLGL